LREHKPRQSGSVAKAVKHRQCRKKACRPTDSAGDGDGETCVECGMTEPFTNVDASKNIP